MTSVSLFLTLLLLTTTTFGLNCTTETTACAAANAACVAAATNDKSTPDLAAMCKCSMTARDCFTPLQTECPIARNQTALFVELCESVKCGAKCDGAPYLGCDLDKISNCSRQAGVCEGAPNANNCTCLAAMRECVGDAQLKTCGYYQSFFPEIVNQCQVSKCPAQCAAVPGCDFDLALKCGDHAACAADPYSCACLEAKHACLVPLAKTCDVVRGAFVEPLQTQCVRASCTTACSRPLATTCAAGSLVLSPTVTDTCNSCTCKDGKAASCTRKRCAAQCKGVTECRDKGHICVKDVKMCLVAPCPQYRCLDPSAPAARNDENFDGDEVDETVAPTGAAAVTNTIAATVVMIAVLGGVAH